MNELFKITLPFENPTGNSNMYFKSNRSFVINENGEKYIRTFKKDVISLETYFNVFSYTKYLKYTSVNNVTVLLKLQGKYMITVYDRRDYGCFAKYTDIVDYKTPQNWNCKIDFSTEDKDIVGYYFVTIESLDEEGKFFGGTYLTDAESNNKVKIALNICTFKRESYVINNLNNISKYLFEASDSSVKDELEVFIVDNGNTLKGKIEENDKVHLFPNKNYGGSGGFTRGLLEALKRKNDFTHILMSDDDTSIDPNVISKTINFVKYLREDHFEKSHIAGGMLHFDNPVFQEEASSIFDCGVRSLKKGRVLEPWELLHNDREESAMYGAWWYLCIPMTVVNDNNLPLPLFIKCDDIEYGVRNIKEVIVMNGIGVWHERFDKKYSQHLEYFIRRNELVLYTIYGKEVGLKLTNKTIFDIYFRAVGREMFRHRYGAAKLIIRAMNDYSKGVDFFINQKEDLILKEVLTVNPKLKTKEELYNDGITYNDLKYLKSKSNETSGKWFKFAFISLLIPKIFYSNETEIVDYLTCHPYQFVMKKRVLQWHPYDKKGYQTEFSKKECFNIIFDFFRVYFKVCLNLNKIKRNYKDNVYKLMTLNYWVKHLELDDLDVMKNRK